MFSHLQISNPRERALVGVADLVLDPLRLWRVSITDAAAPRRVLLLRLERIGDLLMVLDAIAQARAAWPDAEIDLAIGSWNQPLASLIPGVNRVIVADVPWLAREGTGLSWPALVREARGWRAHGYDLAVNFEPDVRTNFLAWLSGAKERAGYWTGGGGALLTAADAYDPASHVSVNAARLIERVAGPSRTSSPATRHGRSRLTVPADALARADAMLGAAPGPWIGVHASGGRESKQWHLDRFADTARALAREHRASIVLTGSTADRPKVDGVKSRLSDLRVIDAAGDVDLVTLAALLARLRLFVSSDTGPMHLAAAVGTPVVALFGPADPRRYGPLSDRARVVRVDLPCSPCGQVRLPPERCRGHVPDCMDGISVAAVVEAARALLAEPAPAPVIS